MGLSEFSTLFGLNTGEVFGGFQFSSNFFGRNILEHVYTHIHDIYIYIYYIFIHAIHMLQYMYICRPDHVFEIDSMRNSCTSHKPFPHHRSGHLPTHRLLQDRCHLDHRHHQQARLMHLLIGESWCGVNKYLGAGAHVYTSYYFIFI